MDKIHADGGWFTAAVLILVFSVLFFLLLGKMGISLSTWRNKDKDEKPPAKDPKEGPSTTVPPTAPEPSQKKDEHGAGHGGGHGGGILSTLTTIAFLALIAYGAYWLYTDLQSMKDVEKVQHPVRVERPGPGHVPVTAPRELDMDEARYCQQAPDNAREFPVSSEWSEEIGTPRSKFCSDPGPRMGGFKAECREYEGSPFAPCTSQYVAVRFTTIMPRRVWVERLRYK